MSNLILVKITILFFSHYVFNRSMSPPNLPPSRETIIDKKERKRFAFILIPPLFARLLHFITCLGESALILAKVYPNHICHSAAARFLVFTPDAEYSISRIESTPAFYLGCLFFLSGIFVRLRCFRELGRFFTFLATIHDDHKLITSGPYAYVRHPSYTGLLLCFIGAPLCHLTTGTWIRECGVLDTRLGVAIVLGWNVSGMAGIGYAIRRTGLEDEALAKKFGEEWKAWASVVRYKLIPGVW